jgi:hypothetical protein
MLIHRQNSYAPLSWRCIDHREAQSLKLELHKTEILLKITMSHSVLTPVNIHNDNISYHYWPSDDQYFFKIFQLNGKVQAACLLLRKPVWPLFWPLKLENVQNESDGCKLIHWKEEIIHSYEITKRDKLSWTQRFSRLLSYEKFGHWVIAKIATYPNNDEKHQQATSI